MLSYNHYKDILEKAGYENTFQTDFCGVPSSMDFEDDKGHIVTLGIQPTAEYDAELQELGEGEEYMPDFDRMEVHSAAFSGPICNVAGYMDNGRSGMFLKDSEPVRYSLLDGIGGDDYQDYYPHKMDLFEKCLWIQSHIADHEENILVAHIVNLKRIRTEFDPVLTKYDFFQEYSSVFDCTEDSTYQRSNSNLTVRYRQKYSNETLSISTDCITGELMVEGERYTAADFDEYFKKILTDKDGTIRIEYRYLFDSDYTPNSAAVILNAMQALIDYKNGSSNRLKWMKSLDLSAIPEKDYGNLVSQIKEILSAE